MTYKLQLLCTPTIGGTSDLTPPDGSGNWHVENIWTICANTSSSTTPTISSVWSNAESKSIDVEGDYTSEVSNFHILILWKQYKPNVQAQNDMVTKDIKEANTW